MVEAKRFEGDSYVKMYAEFKNQILKKSAGTVTIHKVAIRNGLSPG